jgi:hypothetical protein
MLARNDAHDKAAALAILLDANPAALLMQDSDGSTPLHLALSRTARPVDVAPFLSSEAGMRACCISNDRGVLPLEVAIEVCSPAPNTVENLRIVLAASLRGGVRNLARPPFLHLAAALLLPAPALQLLVGAWPAAASTEDAGPRLLPGRPLALAVRAVMRSSYDDVLRALPWVPDALAVLLLAAPDAAAVAILGDLFASFPDTAEGGRRPREESGALLKHSLGALARRRRCHLMMAVAARRAARVARGHLSAVGDTTLMRAGASTPHPLGCG